jgi:hypothetical protein
MRKGAVVASVCYEGDPRRLRRRVRVRSRVRSRLVAGAAFEVTWSPGHYRPISLSLPLYLHFFSLLLFIKKQYNTIQ